ncbi:CYTH domain-containing protein [Bowmanella dokdonensis]|uniref:CYTH and CHAD domain-containing protein n=1 Tax=Bowmanella dokdonensis TaxID=751969 RepID=A0A939IRX8_9ALTE|nr:CYTH and CHAD domain-containing protein [Bowmanella dokdonensis]MBN7826559.1 CYTH and CHAD domain-containing protein [Bowmanella dokdonensis]
METEIELKLLVDANLDVVSLLEQQLLPTLDARCESSRLALSNRYFDTPDKRLRALDIGFRVRGQDGRFVQTVKTAGQSAGGLHQRPEYNVALEDQHPDLTRFDPAIWPDGVQIDELQKQLRALFTTHFHRQVYLLSFEDGTVMELVFDKGQIATDSHQLPISEIEIELKKGQVNRLFDVADKLSEIIPLRLGTLSKAARGYLLSEGQELEPRELPDFLDLAREDTVETAFCRTIRYGLAYWQYHEECYLSTEKPRALRGIYTGIHLVSQAISLYLPILQCDRLLDLQHSLMEQMNDWFWCDTLMGIKTLRSKKGPFRKRLARSEELLSYLRGRFEGLLLRHEPRQLIRRKCNSRLQLELAALPYRLPWRTGNQAWQAPVVEHAKGWLAQGWFNVSQSMPRKKKMGAQHYLSSEPLLRQTLFNGLFLAGLFAPEHRDQFRAPWLDIIDGVEELKALSLLKSELEVAQVQDSEELLAWSKDKVTHLLDVMEQSRKAALKMEPYWK